MTMTRDDLHGFVPAIVTPFDDKGRIDDDAFLAIADYLLSRGATAICIAGDNGESWALSPDERRHLTRRLVDHLGGRAKVILGVSAPTGATVDAYVAAARDGGADALLSMPPTYVLKASDVELAARWERLAKSDLPLILYNSPRRAGLSMTIDQIERACDAAPVIGIKESHRDFFHHSHLLDRLADRISVMTGPCHYILPTLALGARGFIATGPELITARPADLPTMAMGPDAASRAAHRQLTGIYETLMGQGTWPAAFKAALSLIGLPAGVPRDPVLPLGPEDMDRLRAAMDHLGITRK
ncbi:MAG: dihydrodipicolinate synthase family protein [Pseudomonadota bacterium]